MNRANHNWSEISRLYCCCFYAVWCLRYIWKVFMWLFVSAWDIRFLCSDSLAEGCNTFPLFVCASGSYSIETWCCLKTGCCRVALRISVAPQSSFGERWEGITEHFGILKAKERLQYREVWFHWKSWVWCVIKVQIVCSFYFHFMISLLIDTF